MRVERKANRQYWFTVEGNTEGWYLEHVQNLINNDINSKYRININHEICRSPASFAKRANALSSPEIFHLCDIESTSQEHLKSFSKVLSELKDAKKDKDINYRIGYSNYTFELWIILHKKQLTNHLADRSGYLKHINSAYSKSFERLSEYKKEENFKGILKAIDIDSIIFAIKNAEEIENLNKKNKQTFKNEYGFNYCLDNPSLSIHEAIKQILKDCKLL